MPEMVAPRALVFRPLVKGNEALGTRLISDLTEQIDRLSQTEMLLFVKHFIEKGFEYVMFITL